MAIATVMVKNTRFTDSPNYNPNIDSNQHWEPSKAIVRRDEKNPHLPNNQGRYMAILRCTQKLLNELKVKPVEESTFSDDVGSWHVNLLRVDRRKCILFTHDVTLYSFFVPGLKKPQFEIFQEVFGQNLFKNLLYENFPQNQIEIVLDKHREIVITKTNNRSVLGSMNDLAFQLKYLISGMGGLVNVDILKLNKELNRIPMSSIEEIYSIYEFRKLLHKLGM